MTFTTDPQTIADELAAAGGRSVRRFVNDSLVDAARDGPDREAAVLELVCECGDLSCTEVVRVPLSAFDRRDELGPIVAHGVESSDGGGS
jgi:hypothetical protein